MNFEALKQNIMDNIKESQIKLGYSENAVGLNYTLDSLALLLGTQADIELMSSVLAEFTAFAADPLGKITVRRTEDKFLLTVPPEGVRFVNENVPAEAFLVDLIDLLRGHSAPLTLESVLAVFRKHSDKVVCREIGDDEFDYLIYFEDGIPDSYRYCVQFDLGHMIYHRMTPGDFAALYPELC